MRRAADRRRTGTLFGEVLSGGHALYLVRRGSRFPLSLGSHTARIKNVWLLGDDGVHRNHSGGSVLRLEKRRARLGPLCREAGGCLVAIAPPIIDVEQLKSHPALRRLVDWNAAAVRAVKFDRGELTIWIDKGFIREVCAILRDDADCPFNYRSEESRV